MSSHADRAEQSRNRAAPGTIAQRQTWGGLASVQLDQRPTAAAQRSVVAMICNSPQIRRAAQLQAAADSSLQVRHLQSIQAITHQQSPVQLKWVDDGGKNLSWDQLMDGVQWYCIKDTGLMFYRIVDPKAIRIGSLQDYRALEGEPKEHGFWKAHQAIDLDITGHLDPSVISPDKASQGPDGHPTGMAAMDPGRFLSSARDVQTGWDNSSAEIRAGKLIQSVNAYLQAAGVPPIKLVLKPGDKDSHGSFSECTWSITLNEGAFSAKSVDSDAMAEMADTVFHEARHAEQFYRIAQMLAALGHSVAEIRAKMVLNSPIDAGAAAQAHAHPMPLDPNGLSTAFMETLGWYQSLYGARAKLRQTTIRTMKEAQIQAYQVLLEMHALRQQFKIIKDDLELLKFDTESEQMDLQLKRDEIVKQIEACTLQGKSVEALELGKAKVELETQFGDLARAYNAAAKQARLGQLAIVEQQKQTKEIMDKALAEYEHWQELYKQLPEELDAWVLGGSIQEAYKQLV